MEKKLFEIKIRHVKLESAGDNNLILRVLSLKFWPRKVEDIRLKV